MYEGKRFLAVIPARGGSKGIPKKNIIELKGKPLIHYTIEAAKSSKFIDDVIVTTDSEEIASVAKEAGAEIPFIRPAELASDTAKSIDVLIHAITELEKAGRFYDYLVLLQPTQPLRLSMHIDGAIEKIVKTGKSSLTSVSPVQEHPILIRSVNESEELEPVLKTSSTVRRQDFPEFYKVNGAIYINKIEDLTNNTSLNDNQVPYMMEYRYSIDIDELIDLEIAKIFLESK
ncbi:acylneuraminate cytidylyltransferase family protein [Metabacillus arenae]|uniref:Acylneuraminate cytidylyltransferase family protein n=1 Tax=Metabacillus arenae TaxID=2771434 RepID=A0A926RZD8_9BACI|nr:acylneuraminate cytidylyltransferase family protein [Metabacillus arenae]MBD1383011.1 acylneuraminate cytidylyltransferase family protein [Metabacillus arenae]